MVRLIDSAICVGDSSSEGHCQQHAYYPADTHQYHGLTDKEEDHQDNEEDGDGKDARNKYVGLPFELGVCLVIWQNLFCTHLSLFI